MTIRRLAAALLLSMLAGSTACEEKTVSQPRGTIAPTDVGGPPADAIRTDSGLFYRILVPGAGGRHPGPNARVTVHYTGWTTDGTIVEGAPVGDPPATLELNMQMPGWREGIRMMVPGEKRRFWIPSRLAYEGKAGRPQGMLVYDIELLQFVD
jgi:FKBP-type peptidyl-prolyl cis-trans isomerase